MNEFCSSPSNLWEHRGVGWNERWTRDGWRVAYTPLGGRSRSPLLDAARRSLSRAQSDQVDALTSRAFMAVSVDPADDVPTDVLYFVAIARKILQRGANPLFDHGTDNDLAEVTPAQLLLAAAGPLTSGHALDESIKLDATYERPFWDLIMSGHASLTRWLVPQPSYESLTSSDGDASRWADFLLCAPWMTRPAVIELDGSQHKEAIAVDRSRDAGLHRANIDVLRFGGGQVLSEQSELRTRLHALGRTPPAPDQLLLARVHAPAAATRLGIALLELLESGALAPSGDWTVDVQDEHEWAALVTGSVLEVFRGIGQVWGLQIAPKRLRTRMTTWVESESGYQEAPAEAVEVWDAEVRLEPFVPAWASLEPATRPTVVIRNAAAIGRLDWLPIPAVERRDVNETNPDVEVGLRILLRHLFGHDAFREGQASAVLSALAGVDACVLLPTGAGKSLIYQMAGLLRPGATLIIDPLTSLVDDQERRLREDGIDRVVAIHGGKTASATERDRLYREVARGDALFAFLTPERLQIDGFRTALASAAEHQSINLAVIDEAHCVSEWGHDFRTAYLRVGRNVRLLSRGRDDLPPPLLALTGTASPAVLRDVLIELEATPESMRILRPASFDRPNLSYAVSLGEQDTWVGRLRETLLERIPEELGCESTALTALMGSDTRSGLVFVPHTNGEYGVEKVKQHVVGALNLVTPAGEVAKVEIYSGGKPRSWTGNWNVDKVDFARRFKDNECTALVTTKPGSTDDLGQVSVP